MGMNVPTIQDVADLAGVSIATVSRVMNDSPHKVSEAARGQVLKAVATLNYRPNALARGLHAKKTMTIGIIIPDISNSYYTEIVRGIQDSADQSGYAVILQNTDRKQKQIVKCIHLLREKLADGIIFSGGIIQGAELLSALGELQQRVVVIGRHDVDFPAVRVDNVHGAQEATQYLIGLGHRRIGFVGGSGMSTTIQDRLKGYKKALLLNGIQGDKKLIKQGALTPISGYSSSHELFQLESKPTAILTANDRMSFGVVKAAREAGLVVPDDLSVIGFDNLPLGSYFNPPLTTVGIPRYELGVAAMEMLLNLIAGKSFERVRWFKTRLVLRGSAAAKKGPFKG